MESQALELNKNLMKLYTALEQANNGKNIVSSTLSIYACLAMLAQGLKDKSFSELQSVLGYGSEGNVL